MIKLYDLLVLIHVFAIISWLGAMYFNLTLIFPMYKSHQGTTYAELMQEQGTRAAPLLYALIILTVVSGIWLANIAGQQLVSYWMLGKLGCLLLMVACHLYGSFVLWPRVFLALPQERDNLFYIYKLSMLVSATAGSIAVVLTYLGK